MSHKKRTILTHIFQYASASYFSQIIGFFSAVLMRRFLGPVNMGIWNILKVVLDYSNYAHLGIISIAPYKLPILRGRGEDDRSLLRLKSIIFSFTAITAVICALCVTSYAILQRGNLEPQIFYGLIVVSILILLHRFYTSYILFLRVDKNFLVLSCIIIFDAIVNLLLIIFIVSRFFLLGLFWILIAMYLLNILFINLLVRYRLRFTLDRKEIVSMLKSGFPIFMTNILQEILNSVDRIIIAGMLGMQQLGFYSIALMVRSYGTSIVNNFSIVIQPHFMEDIGKSNDSKTNYKYIFISSEVTSYIMCFILSCVFIITVPFIMYVLPKFSPGITAMKIFLLTTLFFALCDYCYDYTIALNKQSRLIIIIVLSLIINISLSYFFIKNGYGINGVAASTALASFFYFCAVSIYALKHFKAPVLILKFFLKTLFPLVYSLFLLLAINSVYLSPNIILNSGIRLLLFTIFSLPVAFYLNKRTGIISTFFNLLISKMHRENAR